MSPTLKEIRISESIGGNFGGIGSLSSTTLEKIKPFFETRPLILLSFVCNTILLFTAIVFYSLLQSQNIRMEGMSKRVELLSVTINDLIHGQRNSEKLEQLDERVSNMKNSVAEIKDIIEESTGAASEAHGSHRR